MLKSIKFVGIWPPYYPGDRAGFPPGVAASLVASGVGVYVAKEDREAAEAQTAELVEGPVDAASRTRTVAEVAQLAAELEDREALLALRRGEATDPHRPGGRVGVLAVIDRRLGALAEDEAKAEEEAVEGDEGKG